MTVYQNNRRAMREALAAGAHQLPNLADVLNARESPSNPFFTPGS
jgi:5,6,7,8-tetrahydromethanopterin hydro-lyase